MGVETHEEYTKHAQWARGEKRENARCDGRSAQRGGRGFEARSRAAVTHSATSQCNGSLRIGHPSLSCALLLRRHSMAAPCHPRQHRRIAAHRLDWPRAVGVFISSDLDSFSPFGPQFVPAARARLHPAAAQAAQIWHEPHPLLIAGPILPSAWPDNWGQLAFCRSARQGPLPAPADPCGV